MTLRTEKETLIYEKQDVCLFGKLIENIVTDLATLEQRSLYKTTSADGDF